MLAGVLLKLRYVGLLRLIEVIKISNNYICLFIFTIGLIVVPIVRAFQRDIKSIVAYSSIAHINFVSVALFITTRFNREGSFVLAIAHGYTSSVVFYYRGVLFYSTNSRKIYYTGGRLASSLIFAIIIILSRFTNFSVPPRLAFIGEFAIIINVLSLISIYSISLFMYVIGVCYYTLYLIVNIITGKIRLHFKTESLFISVIFILISFNLITLGGIGL